MLTLDKRSPLTNLVSKAGENRSSKFPASLVANTTPKKSNLFRVCLLPLSYNSSPRTCQNFLRYETEAWPVEIKGCNLANSLRRWNFSFHLVGVLSSAADTAIDRGFEAALTANSPKGDNNSQPTVWLWYIVESKGPKRFTVMEGFPSRNGSSIDRCLGGGDN